MRTCPRLQSPVEFDRQFISSIRGVPGNQTARDVEQHRLAGSPDFAFWLRQSRHQTGS